MSHPQPPADWDSAAAEDRRRWIGHAEACSSCRDSWISKDPSRMFSFLADCPVVDEATEQIVLDRLSASVRGKIRAAGTGSRWFHLAAAAVLVAALAAPLAAWMLRAQTDSGVRNVAVAEPVPPLAEVDVLYTPGTARVIDLSVGDTQVVMIFDPRLEI